MTQKYFLVRREIWEKDPRKITNGKRTIRQMGELFKWPQIVVLVLVIACSAFMILSSILWPTNILAICIPMGIVLILAYLSQVVREKFFYHLEARQDELKQVKQDYDEYVQHIHGILQKYDVDKKDFVERLKCECESTLTAHEKKYSVINSQALNTLIGVPIGALVASIIYTGQETNYKGIVLIVTLGFAFLAVTKVIGTIAFYTSGYFKDRYVLDALNELVYSNPEQFAHYNSASSDGNT